MLAIALLLLCWPAGQILGYLWIMWNDYGVRPRQALRELVFGMEGA